MTIRVEKEVVVCVPAKEPGSEAGETLELREGGAPDSVEIHGSAHGTQVFIGDLRQALQLAEQEFA